MSYSVAVKRQEEGLNGDAALCAAKMADLTQTLQCSATAAALALHRERQLLFVGPALLARRVLQLRAAAPSADLMRLCLLAPRLLASPDEEWAFFQASADALRAALPDCDWVDLCIQEDPELMLCDIRPGLAGLSELWTPEQLATMDPDHASLAMRALCGLPRRGVVPGWTKKR